MIDAYQAPVIKATAVANSQSTIKLHTLQWFTATAAGKSRIYYKGNPTQESLVMSGEALIVKE
jgi:hypothetical protein